jgi:hypothetical protein
MWKSLPIPVRQFAHDFILWAYNIIPVPAFLPWDLFTFIVAGLTMLCLWTVYIWLEESELRIATQIATELPRTRQDQPSLADPTDGRKLNEITSNNSRRHVTGSPD